MEKPVANDMIIKEILDGISVRSLMNGLFFAIGSAGTIKALANIKSYIIYKNYFTTEVRAEFPPEVVARIRKAHKFVNSSEFDQEVKQNILHFYNTMITCPGFISSFFLYNLERLKFKEIVLDERNEFFIAGNYDINDSSISFSEKYGNRVIFHELLHMSSSIKINNNYFSGFFQHIKNNRRLGEGLNEGYTELLTHRYFQKGENIGESGYVVLVHFMSALEKIVGSKELMEFYFKADLKSLIDFLNQYISREEIMLFIMHMDYLKDHLINQISLTEKICCQKSITYISEFLVKTYCSKLKLFFKTLDPIFFYNQAVSFVKSLECNLKVRNYKYNFVNIKNIEKILEDSFLKENKKKNI